jgi:molybdenum cofactor guanylyltransferase
MSCNPIYPDEPIQMLGVVLCGGQSSRMGTDKGLLLRENKSWVEIAAVKLESLGLTFCVSINESQEEVYSQFFELERMVKDTSTLHGPLKGLLSVHQQFPDTDLFVLACDMPDVTEELMQKLLDIFREHEGEHDFFVFCTEQGWEPLLGIYTREGLQKFSSLLFLEGTSDTSMKGLLEKGNTYFHRLSMEEQLLMKNYNTL